MKTFTKVNNGHTLTIEVNEQHLLSAVQERINYFTNEDEEDIHADLEQIGCYATYYTLEEVLQDCNEFKELVDKIVSGEMESELWNKVALKKNGSFKKTVKTVLKESINGPYWEDSYGWCAFTLRIVPKSDTLAEIRFDDIVIHY